MHVIADSHSTRTEWVIVDGDSMMDHAVTSGLNPFFLSRREISHIIRLELPEAFFRRRWEHIYFYGAGCSTPEKCKIVQSSLIAQFKTPATVESDLLGAARGLLIDSPGLVSILSTGANSCDYDGEKIVKNVRAGGYILGDEGSNAYLGKRLLSDILKEIAPRELIEKFYSKFSTNANELMDLIYTHPQPNRTLAVYSFFLADNISNPYCEQLVYEGIMEFFRRNIAQYDYKNTPVSFVGSTGNTYRKILERAAKDFGVKIGKVETSSIGGLIKYHGLHR